MCHKLCLANHFLAYERITFHRGNATADRCKQFYAEDKGVTRHYLLTELHTIYLHEVGRVAFGFVYGVQYKQTAYLCHSFNLQHTRHYRFLWEVPLEERLVGSDILHAYNIIGTYFNHLVYQLEWVTVWQQFADTVYVHDGFAVTVVSRSLYIMQADFLTHLAGELVINGMSRTCSDDTSLDRFAYQSQVTDYVEQFMTGTFIGPYQRFVVDITQLLGIHVGNSHHIGQLIEVFLRHFSFVDNDGIVQITAFDKTGLQQWFDLAYEYECTAAGYFISEFRHILQRCKLIGNDGRVVRYQYIQTEVLVGQHDNGRTGLFIAKLDF